MARRRPSASHRKTNRPRKLDRPGKSVREFCQAYGIGRATFYNWKKLGIAPAIVQPAGPRGWQIITPEAEGDWKKARSTPVAAAAPIPVKTTATAAE
jgi:hypothetical protein